MVEKIGDKLNHTVEKIGGTSMSDFETVLENIIIGSREKKDLYARIFVVSAYGGITDQLLEHKKTGKPGVYALFSGAENRWAWGDDLTRLEDSLKAINRAQFVDKTLRHQADQFILDRVEGVRECLIDLQRLCSYGHFQLEEHLLTVREMLAGVGEAHSAFNTALRLQAEGINARFIDLTGWRDPDVWPLDDKLERSLSALDLERELPICTGYTQCREGLMRTFDRGYSEMTFSRIAVITRAREAIIHKEFHLSSADPKIVGETRVTPIGRTNYDVADQLANLGMEAIHPKAAKGLRHKRIPLRVRNSFDPEHSGTLITPDYVSQNPHVEIIAGHKSVIAVSVFDQNAPEIADVELKASELITRFNAHSINRDSNANTLTYYLDTTLKQARRIVSELKGYFTEGEVSLRKVAIVAAIGSDLDVTTVTMTSLAALCDGKIAVLAMHQSMRNVEVQFVVENDDFEKGVAALHSALIEPNSAIQESIAVAPQPTGNSVCA